MASVAKNVRAVQLLLGLGASTGVVNASGMTALMCAARVGLDGRSKTASANEPMAQSARIVDILLAHGAPANVAERVKGNTALHFAVLSENLHAVESLIANARNLDIAARNKAEQTALDLCQQISGAASTPMEDRLRERWAQCEEAAARRSAELLSLTVGHDAGRAKRQPTLKAPTRRREAGTKVKLSSSGSPVTSAAAREPDASTASWTLASASKDTVLHLHAAQAADILGDDEATWQNVSTKKSRESAVRAWHLHPKVF